MLILGISSLKVRLRVKLIRMLHSTVSNLKMSSIISTLEESLLKMVISRNGYEMDKSIRCPLVIS